MARMTPKIGSSGRYELGTPFATRPNTIYTCKAIRSFDDIYKLNEDVFKNYYQPYGISDAKFRADEAEGALIITLMSNQIGLETGASPLPSIIYVPDTYILHFPDGNNVPYSHMVVSMSLGSIPDYLDLSDIMADIADIGSKKIGVTPVVKQHRALSSGTVTPAQHDTIEAGRQATLATNIEDRQTIYTKYEGLTKDYADMKTRYDDLEASYILVSGNSSGTDAYLESIGYYNMDSINVCANQTLYVDGDFIRTINLDVDYTGKPISSYVSIAGPTTVNGITATVTPSKDIHFDLERSGMTSDTAVFNIELYNASNVLLSTYQITVICTNKFALLPLSSAIFDMDLTLNIPHVKRIRFDLNELTRTLIEDLPLVDPFDRDHPYYTLSSVAAGITVHCGKNWIEFIVDEASYTGTVNTNVVKYFIKREGIVPTVVDTNVQFTLHITNTP